MSAPRISVGLPAGTSPPFRNNQIMRGLARLIGAETVWVVDHYTGLFPKSVWDKDFAWRAGGGSPDHYFDWQVIAGRMARSKMSIGVGVTEPIRRHPVTLAQAALTMSHVSKRPFILGLGAGEAENVIPYGLSFDRPVARLEEALQVIRACFDSTEPITFEGRFYHLDRASMDLMPGEGGTPRLWIAAHAPRMLRLAGRYGDGWFPTIPMSPSQYAGSLGVIRAAAGDVGRDPEAIVPSMQIFYVVAPSKRAAERYLAHPAIKYFSLLAPDSSWRQAGLKHPLGEGFRGYVDIIPARLTKSEVWDAIGEVPADFAARQVIWGTAGRVVEQIQALGEAGLRHAVLAPVSAMISRRALLHTARTLPGIARRLRTGM